MPHVHLLLNYYPTIGSIIGLGLFIVSLIAKSNDLKRASLGIFFIIALSAIPAYLSGNAAQMAIADQPGVSKSLIERHNDGALLALVFMEITGVVSWIGLWKFRQISRLAGWNVAVVLLFSTLTVGLMARTANTGGEIRHEEIRPVEETTSTEGTAGTGWLRTAAIASFVINYKWAWAASESLHFIGLCLLMGVVLVANLRMLGMMKNVSFSALHRLLPWAMFGFVISAITGFLFFITASDQYTLNVAFYLKMVFLFLAGLNVLYLTAFEEPWAVRPGDDAPRTAKVIAASGIFLWFGVIVWGRLMPFLGLTF